MNEILFSPIPVSELQQLIQDAVSKVISGQTNSLPDEYIDRSELMQVTGISSFTTVIKYEKMKIFKPHRVGKKILYRRSEVLEAIRKFQRI